VKKLFVVLLSLVVAALMLAACGGGGGSGALDITIAGNDAFRYVPETINAKPGQTVNLTFKNEGVLEHSLVIEAVGLKITAAASQTVAETFTAPAEAGEYEIHCDIAGHKEGGMVGMLVVAP
jgi:plastocyanin